MSGFRWIRPPEELAKAIEEYGQRVLVAVQAAATFWGQNVQDAARQDAPWEDRTGAARGGLFFAVDGFGLPTVTGQVTPEARMQMTDVAVESGDKQTLIVTLGHTVFYGKFLEVSNGGRYGIVLSTMERNLPRLERLLKDIFR